MSAPFSSLSLPIAMNGQNKKKNVKKKPATQQVELSEELKNALGGAADIVLEGNKLSKEEKRRKKLKEEKKAQKLERKGKRAKKLEEIAVCMLLICCND